MSPLLAITKSEGWTKTVRKTKKILQMDYFPGGNFFRCIHFHEIFL